jgi:hypothetical protein
MKKRSMNGTVHGAGRYLAPAFAVAALVVLLLAAGCTTGTPAPQPTTTTPATPVLTTVVTAVPTTVEVTPDAAAVDRAFADAADSCYKATPVITNLSTHLAFATCMKDTPLPLGNCAQNYRYYVLKNTNEDPSSAGFARETENSRLAREAYLRGEGWDAVSLQYVKCGNATLIQTSIYR